MAEDTSLLKYLSLNQITTEHWNLKEAAIGCAQAEVPWISIWRHKLEALGIAESKRIIKGTGLKVSSLCRGGMFPAATEEQRRKNLDDNKRAVEEAAELGTDVLVLVCGPALDRNIDLSRQWVEEGIEQLVPFAESCGVRLGIEPLHPMYAADRSVIVTLGQANKIAQEYSPDQVGVVVDVFHVWWDPELYKQIARAKERILGFHVSDWNVPITDTFKARRMMGDGVIEIRRIRKAVEEAGYHGPIEVEIMNQELWDMPGEDVLKLMKNSFVKHV